MKYSKIAIMTLALLGASSQANSSMFSRAASFLKRPAQDAMIKATNKYPRFTAYVQKTDWLGVKVTLGLAAGGALCTTMGSGDPVLAPLGAIPILYMGLGLSMPLGLAITSATIGTCAMLKASHTMYYSRQRRKYELLYSNPEKQDHPNHQLGRREIQFPLDPYGEINPHYAEYQKS